MQCANEGVIRELPPLDVLVVRLAELASEEVVIDPDAAIGCLPVDSLEVLEWLYTVVDDLGDEEFALDDDVAERFFELTLRQLHTHFSGCAVRLTESPHT